MSVYFIILFILITFQAFCVIISKNPITSILFLISVYILTSVMFLLLGAEFLAILLIIVYVGAISILFLFVVMMLNLRIVEVYNTLITYFPIGSFIGLLFILEFVFLIHFDSNIYIYYLINDVNFNLINLIDSKSNLYLLGELLYNEYYFFLFFAGLILLLAMVGAITLTNDFEFRKKTRRNQEFIIENRLLRNRISFWQLMKKF